jgi:hypothetical protein
MKKAEELKEAAAKEESNRQVSQEGKEETAKT